VPEVSRKEQALLAEDAPRGIIGRHLEATHEVARRQELSRVNRRNTRARGREKRRPSDEGHHTSDCFGNGADRASRVRFAINALLISKQCAAAFRFRLRVAQSGAGFP